MSQVPNILSPNEKAFSSEFNANWQFCLNADQVIQYNTDLSQVGIYNILFYSAESQGPSSGNDAALVAMFAAMEANCAGFGGGFGTIPPGSYAVDANSYSPPDQSVIWGLGSSVNGSDSLTMLSIVGDGNLFVCNNTNQTSGGQIFEHLAISAGNAAQAGTTAFVAQNQNVRVRDTSFIDVPVVFNASGTTCGLEACTINKTGGPIGVPTGANGSAFIYLTGASDFVIGPGEITQSSINPTSGTAGPTGWSGISLGGGTKHALVRDVHISELSYCLNYQIGTNAQHDSVVDALLDGYITSVNMVPPVSTGTIFGEKYTDCTIRKAGTSLSGSPLVVIDTNSGTNNNVNDNSIRGATIYNNTVNVQSNQIGVQLNQGAGIKVVHSTIGNMGPTGGANIAITGPLGNAIIKDNILIPTYPNAENGTSASEYALLVSGSPTGIQLVQGNDMTGYSGVPISVTGAPTALYALDNPGYNDANTVVSTTMPTTGAWFSLASLGYYGRGVFYISGGTVTTIKTAPGGNTGSPQTLPLTSGTFWMPFSTTQFQINYTGSPSIVVMGG